jgi:hypothetical protein
MASSSPLPGRSPTLRASDADRERVADELRRHHLDGRLDTDELQERLGACYAARTEGELDALLADLPGEARPRPPRPARRHAAWPASPLAAILLVALALATAGALAHGHPGPLPVLVVLLLFRLGRGGRRPPTVWTTRG